ncbi:beta-lactamase family protein [Flavihumibacter sp. RY-1]|uniref:Beta-lactamase family protein n=1 Tax=Flavihumibacter fluminis TaxID=2909236 RepID=A0ABS9BEZ4_9BACT|nr:serine hydrolase domain-containing protein [Flavihumibacter fluminis]MCF1713704.1 beta-lactamase family protein [Flavihumibacter fluminis]
MKKTVYRTMGLHLVTYRYPEWIGGSLKAVGFAFLVLLQQVVYGQSFPPPQEFKLAISPSKAGFNAERLARLDAWFQAFIDSGKAPNAVAFVARKGQVVYHKSFGFSNREGGNPCKTDAIFRIASQTKAIATVALMTFYEEGKFLLDDPISKYIPAFLNPVVLVRYDTAHPETGPYETRPARSPVTIRQLLSHTAGIPYGHPLENRPEFSIPYLNSMKPDRLEEVINKLAKRPLIADPGEGFVYGLNTDVIGRLIEVISGQPLDKVIHDRVLKPLGMKDSYFYLPGEKHSRLVELYSKERAEDKLVRHKNDTFRLYPVAGAQTYLSAGAGMVSTAEDYARFCQMLLNGGSFNNQRVLSRKTIELMLRNQIGAAEVWDRKDKFGLGFQLITEGSHYADQASPGSFTWGGAYCSEYTIDPKEDLILLVFTNVHPYAHYGEFVRKFRMLVYQALL